MKGLELCQRFFFEVGLPAIQIGLPESLPFLAAGSLAGSQCYGNDDEISRDHGWGPGFAVWLSRDAHIRFANALQSLLDKLPSQYLDYTWQVQPEHTCRVHDLYHYIEYLTGYPTAPESALEWLHIPEHRLFEITHRPVFYDATGLVTQHFVSFTNYPEDAWKKRLSACLAWMWRWGVEYLPRAERRGDLITAAMDWSRFAEYSMKVCFLLNHSYAPYHKWLYREFLKLPVLSGQVDVFLHKGFQTVTELAGLASQIVDTFMKALDNLGYQSIPIQDEHFHIPQEARLLDGYARAIRESITDSQIRNLNIYSEVLNPPTEPTWGWFTPSENFWW